MAATARVATAKSRPGDEIGSRFGHPILATGGEGGKGWVVRSTTN